MTERLPARMPGRPPRLRRRRLKFALVAGVLVLLCAELLAACGFWVLTGQYFTWGRGDAARAAALRGERSGVETGTDEQRAVQRAVSQPTVVHPFLGFVDDLDAYRAAGDFRWPLSEYGFIDYAPPFRPRRPDRFVVAITGGSLALQLSHLGVEALVRELEQSRALRGRTVELVRLAIGGYKQPQQLYAVQYALWLGGSFDAVVNLDGFNEVALTADNVSVGVPAWYPRSWARLLESMPTREQQLRIGKLAVLTEQREARAHAAAGWRWSATAQLLWLAQDRRLAQDLTATAASIERANASRSFAVRGPGADDDDLDTARAQMVDVWRRCSLLLHQLCTANDIAYFHFLQPNQYVPDSKPMGPSERKVAFVEGHPWRRAVLHAYPLLQQQGAALREQGVRFEDLTGLLRDHDEPLYIDTCCHLNQAGSAILGDHIGATMRRALDTD